MWCALQEWSDLPLTITQGGVFHNHPCSAGRWGTRDSERLSNFPEGSKQVVEWGFRPSGAWALSCPAHGLLLWSPAHSVQSLSLQFIVIAHFFPFIWRRKDKSPICRGRRQSSHLFYSPDVLVLCNVTAGVCVCVCACARVVVCERMRCVG